jgi:hypothetical protein
MSCKVDRVILVDWNRSGNQIGTPCPKCGGWCTVYAGKVNEAGETDGPMTCPYRGCDWKAYVAFQGYKKKKESDNGKRP